jgi:hypothetical protein
VLTSDANGLSSWQTPAAGGDSSIHKYDLTLTGNRTLNGNGNGLYIEGLGDYYVNAGTDAYVEATNSNGLSAGNNAEINLLASMWNGSDTTANRFYANTSYNSYGIFSSAGFASVARNNAPVMSISSQNESYNLAENSYYNKSIVYASKGNKNSKFTINPGYSITSADSILFSTQNDVEPIYSRVLFSDTKISLKSDTITIDIPSKGLNKVLTSDAAGNATWQAPIGGGLATADFIYNEEFTGSATLAITIANTAVANKYNVYKNGVLLPLSQYTVSGTTLTLVSRVSADDISINYIK